MNKLKRNKGFTLIEMTVALALVGILMLVLTRFISFISETITTNEVYDAVQSSCITLVEETRNTLQESHSLQCGTFSLQDSIGVHTYTISYTISEGEYPGAYKLSFHARTNSSAVFEREVLLYEIP